MHAKRLSTIATLVGNLVLASSASAAVIPVPNLQDAFRATNSTVTMTPDGIHFGTYADGGAIGGTAVTHLLDGKQLSNITDLSYTFTYRVASQPENYTAAPYMRVFLDSNGDGSVDDDVILDPGYCATTPVDEATDLTFQMVGNAKLRFNDDPCDSLANQASWADIVAAHGSETIVGILVTQGFSVGRDVSALMRSMTINGDTYLFGSPLTGPIGPQGAQGAAGAQGAQGAPGPAGADGAPGQTVTIIQQVAAATGQSTAVTPAKQCRGNEVRTLHVKTIAGWKLVSAQARVRSVTTKAVGNTLKVDLTGKAEANYNVFITARYQRGSATRTIRTQRHLSVVCA